MASDENYLIFLDPENQSQSILTQEKDARVAKDYHNQCMMLLTASQFLTTIQKVALYTESLAEYDNSEILELTYLQQQNPAEFTGEQEQQLISLLNEFRACACIEETDEHVHTSNIRRLFENIGMPDPASIERVLHYYLTKKNKSIADRDKIDLLVTRWGAFRIPGTERMVVLRSERRLQERLESIFQQLTLELVGGFSEVDVLDWLDRYRESLLNVKKMSEIVEKNYKSKLREFKLALGEFFYRPAVMAAIVEVNVTLHNVLQEFYLSERARLELYINHAQRKSGELPEPASPLFSLMSRAEEMRRLLDETQAAITSQQVVDQAEQTDAAADTTTVSSNSPTQVDKLVALLEETLQRTNELSQQLQQEIAKRGE
jgi:hypothetical protein